MIATKAGRALLEAYRDLDNPMREKVNFANGIAAIEREAAAQEREQIGEAHRALFKRRSIVFDKWPPAVHREFDQYDPETKWQGIAFTLYSIAILAEPSE